MRLERSAKTLRNTQRPRASPPEYLARIGSMTHLRRLTTLAELADVAAFMASDQASAMTGTVVNLTDGATSNEDGCGRLTVRRLDLAFKGQSCHIPKPYLVSPLETRRSEMFRWARRKGIDRVTHLLAAVALIGAFGLAAPVAAQVSDQPPGVRVYTLTPERIAAIVAAVAGLIGAVIGGLALARSAGRIATGNGRRGAIVALVMGPIGLVIGGLVVVTADGGLGTGNGLGGGVVAMVVGLIGIALGGLALVRSRRTA